MSSLCVFVLIGCAGDPEAESPEPPKRELPQPSLRMMAPTAIRAGENVTIFGEGFADQEVGQTVLNLEGTFQTTSGKMYKVDLEVIPQFQNQGMVIWNFGPNVPFASEAETGTFRGVLKAKNVGIDGEEKFVKDPIGVEMQVLPSIIIRQMRPVEVGCPAGISASVDNAKFMFQMEAIGLKKGTANAPLRFTYTFLKEHFHFQGTLSNQLAMDPKALFPEKGFVTVVDDVTDGTISTLGQGSNKEVYVVQGKAAGISQNLNLFDKRFGLTYLSTTAVPEISDGYSASSYEAVMNIAAKDSSGLQASRSIKLKVYSPVEVVYNGSSAPVRSFDPVAVSGCIPGGDVGRNVSYSETKSETRSRNVTVTAEGSAGIDIGAFGVHLAQVNAAFGMNVNETVSSAQALDMKVSGDVLPGQFAVFYRQTIQLERAGELRGHGPCGGVQNLGKILVTDWVWSADLAKNLRCPPLPQSNLPPGEILKKDSPILQ